MSEPRFPAGFLWGAATAAYQIEGSPTADGAGESIWDRFAHTPGKIANGDTGDVACDSYHLYRTDIQLLKNLGVSSYRMSIAWSRIFPDGRGAPNMRGVDYYNRVIDALLAAGITPYVTLFHWDLPQAQQDRVGGWLSKDTSKAFADYCGFVARRLSGRVRHFFTINEFSCFIDEGLGSGTKAPGLKVPPARLNQARHNAILGHGMAAQAIRAGDMDIAIRKVRANAGLAASVSR